MGKFGDDRKRKGLLRALVYGPPKSRKTWWVTKLAEAGFNVLLCDIEDGAAVAGNLMHHHHRFGDAKSGATIGLWHGDAEPAPIRHRPMKFARESAIFITRQPIVIAKLCTNRPHTIADRGKICLTRQGFARCGGGGHGSLP